MRAYRRLSVALWCGLLVHTVAVGQDCPVAGEEIERAGDLLVALDAATLEDGLDSWLNEADEAIGDFVLYPGGAPIFQVVAGLSAITLNTDAVALDAYQSPEVAPEGLVGPDPTRSIEVWAYNPTIAAEETLVAWGRRGGPDGTNMSFNYGTNENYGAVGHWGGAGPDIGWNDLGGAPAAGAWHHLVYTFDGDDTGTTRVYADGCEVAEYCNEEVWGQGVINTHPDTLITIGAQIEPDGFALNFGLRGSLSIWRVRIHDGVLTPEQIATNYEIEKECIPEVLPVCVGCPEVDDGVYAGTAYIRQLEFTGNPEVETVEVTEPEGATYDLGTGLLTYDVPSDSTGFDVTIEATNDAGASTFSWSVDAFERPEREEGIEVAGELFVELYAREAAEVPGVWLNNGTLADFGQVGEPQFEEIGEAFAPAVTFNSTGLFTDAYQCFQDAPDGLVGLDPTRSIEVWAYNPEIASEETLVAWARRGGPNGTNMSFNYGVHELFGAVGHWGGDGPDIGWDDLGGAPEAGQWHHLVYTYDGGVTNTTRVYADGELMNSEFLGSGVINTYGGTPITIAAQILDAAGAIDFGANVGTLSIGQIRIHDGVLTPEQIYTNYCIEAELYGRECAGCPEEGDDDYADTHATGLEVEETGAIFGLTHELTATGVDDTGDPVLYTFTATDGVSTFTVGPQESNTAGFALRTGGPWEFSVTVDDDVRCPDAAADATFPPPVEPGVRFVRGDSDSSGSVNLNDGIVILNFLFLGFDPPNCMDAADTDDGGTLLLNDAVGIFNWLFTGGPAPVAPSPSSGNYPPEDCGLDVTDDGLDCGMPAQKCSGA